MMPRYFPEDDSLYEDWHAVATVTLAELADSRIVDLNDGTWSWPKYSDAQDRRLRERILAHFWNREICMTPVGRWKREFLRVMREIMPKYVPLYRIIAEEPERFGASSSYNKSRMINSDYPQAQLSGRTGDYASTGMDNEGQRVQADDIMDVMRKVREYDDVDAAICEELETLFSPFFTTSIGYY